MIETTAPAEIVSRDELVARAKAMIPTLRERAPQLEELRKLPLETIEDFKRAGFITMAQPQRFGGMAHPLEVVVDVSMELARGCGSSGWLSSFWATHQFMVSWFPLEAQEEYWADSPETLSSTIPGFLSVEREEVEGGLRLSGRWKFSSGVDYAEWGLLHTKDEVCLVPRKDFEVDDDWYVSGLKGTGSKGVVVKDAFVPKHRMVSTEAQMTGTVPGAELYDSPWYRVPNMPIFVLNHLILAPVIGMGRGVLDIFDERVRRRLDPQSLQPAHERPGPQLRFAEAAAELDAAEMFLRRNLAEVRAWAETGEEKTFENRARLRRDIAYASKLVAQATNRLVDGMDSSGLFDSSGLHRQARDVRAGLLQFVLQWEETAMQFSRVRWGLDPNTIMI